MGQGRHALARLQLLTDEEHNALLGIPTNSDALARRFTLSQADQELVAGRHGDANRLGYLGCRTNSKSVCGKFRLARAGLALSGWQRSRSESPRFAP